MALTIQTSPPVTRTQHARSRRPTVCSCASANVYTSTYIHIDINISRRYLPTTHTTLNVLLQLTEESQQSRFYGVGRVMPPGSPGNQGMYDMQVNVIAPIHRLPSLPPPASAAAFSVAAPAVLTRLITVRGVQSQMFTQQVHMWRTCTSRVGMPGPRHLVAMTFSVISILMYIS